ncbi:uncharacterized protein LOC144886170 isoform X2 [Branchiostoma floridae x Branchiostoma japonicum]
MMPTSVSLTSTSSSSETVAMETATPFSDPSPITKLPITTSLQTRSSSTGPVTTVGKEETTPPALTTPSVDTHTTPFDSNATTVPATIGYVTTTNVVNVSATSKPDDANVTSSSTPSTMPQTSNTPSNSSSFHTSTVSTNMTTDDVLPTDSADLTTIPIDKNSSSSDGPAINVTMVTSIGNATTPLSNATMNPLLTTTPEDAGQTDDNHQTGPPLVSIILGVVGGVLIFGVLVTVWICKRRNGKDIFKDLIPLVDKKPDTDSGFEDFPYYGEVLSAREVEPVFGQLQVGGHDAT